MKNTLVIYHGNCDDGFAAAFAVRQALGEEQVEYYPGSYAFPPPDCTGRDVIMVDFSYKRPVLTQIAQQANSLRIFDHHKTAQEDLKDFPCQELVFDMERSGAGLAWDCFCGSPRPQFIDYIEDRDLWKKQLPGGDEFTIALRSYPQTFEAWDNIFYHVNALIEEGKTIQRYYRLRIEELKRHAYLATLGGHTCYISNAPYFAASEVAGELDIERDAEFGATYFEVAEGKYQYSLRSRGEFDVSEIAKKYGGGGHKNAAGFNVDYLPHKHEKYREEKL